MGNFRTAGNLLNNSRLGTGKRSGGAPSLEATDPDQQQQNDQEQAGAKGDPEGFGPRISPRLIFCLRRTKSNLPDRHSVLGRLRHFLAQGRLKADSMSAVTAATMAAAAVTSGVRAGSAIAAMGPVMTFRGGRCASAGRACVGDGGLFPLIGATALVAFDTEQEESSGPSVKTKNSVISRAVFIASARNGFSCRLAAAGKTKAESRFDFYIYMRPSIYLKNLQSASNWRAQFNPLRGLTLPHLVALLELGERGDYARLQWLYRFVEKRNSTLRAVLQRRQSSLTRLDWDVRVAAGGGSEPVAGPGGHHHAGADAGEGGV